MTLGIVLQHRFRAAASALAEHVAAGARSAGQLLDGDPPVAAPGQLRRARRGTLARDWGGVLLTQGIHTLDLMLSVAGRVDEVMAYTATTAVHRMETEDLVCSAVRVANGAVCTIEATTVAYPGAVERIEMAFINGGAMLAGTSLELHYPDGGSPSSRTAAPAVPVPTRWPSGTATTAR